MDAPFGITRDEILELAAQKLADDAASSEYVGDRVQLKIDQQIREAVAKAMDGQIEAALAAEMDRILHETITPVNIWGERNGMPTTLRDALAERARIFWDVKVDKEGKPSEYGGRPRHEHLLSRLLNEEFTAAVRQNATDIVTAFKAAVKADAARITNEHIDKLIQVKPR